MILIKEKKGKFLNFFTPAMVIASGSVLLNFLSFFISFIVSLIGNSIQMDFIILNLTILFISQFIGIFIAYYVFIPLFKVRNTEHRPASSSNLIKTMLLTCATFTISYISNLILVNIFRAFQVIPQSGYNNVLLNSEHLGNPFNILIYFLPFTIGAPVYEELVYRRTLIPLMEKRGMGTMAAAISSGLIFALAHLPGDLINGNISGGIIHCWVVFLIGISLGLIYIITRNVIFPIIIHGVLNFISFSGPLAAISGDNMIFLSYTILVITIAILGGIVLVIGLWQLFSKRTLEWVIVLRKKSSIHISRGFIGLLAISTISLLIPIILQIIFLNLGIMRYGIAVYLMLLAISNGLVVIFFLRLGFRANNGFNITIGRITS
ncbi:MAG: CPBP family intramembrane glutamic endopeptidase [Promethearchaeota archaeon]|jgi:membrane protease YdiL (CAAX protease family)